MNVDALRKTIADLMPGLRADLERLVRFPSVAFEGFPEEPVKQAGAAVARLMTDVGLPEVRMVDVARRTAGGVRRAPGAAGRPHRPALRALRRVQPAGRGRGLDDAAVRAHRARRPAVRARRRRRQERGIVMHAGALLALGDDCPVGVKVLIEGQEECGNGGIGEFVKANAELLKADVIVISDVGNYALGVPTLTTSLRGMAACDVEVDTLDGAVHSGMFGGPAPDSLIALCRMVATLHDDKGDVAVKGLATMDYEGADYDEAAFRRRRRAAGRRPHRQRQHRPAAVRQAVDQRDRHRRAGGRRRGQRAHPQGPGARQRAPRARAGARGGTKSRPGTSRGRRAVARQG